MSAKGAERKDPALREDRTPEESLERMKDFTRRIIAVPKNEAVKPKRKRKHR